MKTVENSEIVIIRRPNGFDNDPPKGGVWKIAFADFMTAMMAFFLVLWLINVTNEETRAGIASYFNPVKLAEATVDKKGLRDPLETEKDGTPEGEQERSSIDSDADGLKGYSRTRDDTFERQPRFSESALFEDPYAVLASLVAGSEGAKAENAGGAFETLGQIGQPGLNGGDAQRDPFDPVYWRMSKTPLPNEGPESGGANHTAAEPGTPTPIVQTTDAAGPQPGEQIASGIAATPLPDGAQPGEQAEPAAPQDTAVTPGEMQTADAQTPADPATAAEKTPQPEAPVEMATVSTPEAEAIPTAPKAETFDQERSDPVAESLHGEAAAKKLEGEIADAIANVSPAPGVEVKATDEGLLVSIMDDSDFGMFAIGSAEPLPELIRAVDNIASLLSTREGKLVVRGHTDGRPFRSKDYDNWRLSTARAHMAYYMLVRGGMPETRFERIEGYADHHLKIADNPEAPQNRRVEILIRESGT